MDELVGDSWNGGIRIGTCLPIMPMQAIDGVVMVGTLATSLMAGAGLARLLDAQ